ncbi:MAG: hypothetical protein AAF726_02070 [Planctomycetota bacterium]
MQSNATTPAAALLALALLPAASYASPSDKGDLVLPRPFDLEAFEEQQKAQSRDAKIALGVDAIHSLVQAGQPIDASLGALDDVIKIVPAPQEGPKIGSQGDPDPAQQSMKDALKVLKERADSTAIQSADVDQLQSALFWARIDEAILITGASVQQYGGNVQDAATDLLGQIDDPCTIVYPADQSDELCEVDESIQYAAEKAESVEEFIGLARLAVLDSRLQEARAALAEHQSDGTDVRAEYEMLYRLYKMRSDVYQDLSGK